MANIGPLKSHLEHLEICLEEKVQELAALQLDHNQLKQSIRDKKKEREERDHELQL